ncbi:hypothetical protein V8J88_18420 [Massilia sp. W12]|uniref:hypothetical protein n=1 Tax=Massilia sp. W12 TaxID=3126507 RepID=UPI0030CC3130
MIKLFSAVALSLFSLHASAIELPADKAAYQGDWRGEQMRLHIKQNGKVHYHRKTAEKKVDVSIDLDSFEGHSFLAGVGLFKTRFDVSKPPHKVGDKMKMVVDGVELTKVD